MKVLEHFFWGCWKIAQKLTLVGKKWRSCKLHASVAKSEIWSQNVEKLKMRGLVCGKKTVLCVEMLNKLWKELWNLDVDQLHAAVAKKRVFWRENVKSAAKKKEVTSAKNVGGVANRCVFIMVGGSWCLKSRLAKTASAEVPVQDRDDKWHAAAAVVKTNF